MARIDKPPQPPKYCWKCGEILFTFPQLHCRNNYCERYGLITLVSKEEDD